MILYKNKLTEHESTKYLEVISNVLISRNPLTRKYFGKIRNLQPHTVKSMREYGCSLTRTLPYKD